MASMKICLEHNIDLRVFHIEGKKNTVIDDLSCSALNLARTLAPGLSIRVFTPPLNLTEATSK